MTIRAYEPEACKYFYIHGSIIGGPMFGYIFPDKPELKIKEFELFKAYYCGLCKSIGSECGQSTRFILNYDSSFLGFFLSSFNSSPETIKFERCIAHPFAKRPVITESEVLKYAADINVLLAYHKLEDDFHDEKSVKSAGLMGVFHSAYSKASRRNSDSVKVIRERLSELSSIEKKGCSSSDEAAEPFARLTEEVFAYRPLCRIENNEKLLRWFGYNIGKWIYLLDAYDDIEKDIKNKNFNPLLNQFCYNNEKAQDFKERIKENIKFTLTYTLSEAGKAFELMNIVKNREIIENIIYGGMYKRTLKILSGCAVPSMDKSLDRKTAI